MELTKFSPKFVGRMYRAIFDISVSDMAKSLGVSSSSISNYESERTYSERLDEAYAGFEARVREFITTVSVINSVR